MLPSPSTSGSVRGDVSQPRACQTLSLLEQHRQIIPLESGTKTPSNDTNFQSDFAKSQSHPLGSTAGRKRKYEKDPTQSRKRPPECDLVEPPPKQRQQCEETAPELSVHVSKSSVSSQKEPGVSEENERNKILDPISHWAAHGIWPNSFQERVPMPSSGKRLRTSSSPSGKDEKSRSYSQSRKDGDVPEQYTPAYERHVFTKGLDMDVLRGEEFVSEHSKRSCSGLMKITRHSIKPIVFPEEHLRKVINLLGTRNEAIVNRDITTMIAPPLASLYFSGDKHLEHVVDEVNADWYEQCVLEGPRIRPDLAIGLLSSSFTEAEIDKLKRYTSVDNWTQFTSHMYFPFLMCEVKSGREGLNAADRQNMHSCSVAVRALLRIEQEADKYRSGEKLRSLLGQVLVFSISHNQQDVRLFGHYAIVREEKWTYHRYCIGTFNILTGQKDLVTLYNFVQNVLKSHASDLVKRLKDALSALPEPSTLSIDASSMSLNDDPQQNSQERDADGFAVPALPGASLNREMAKKLGQNDKLLEQIMKQNEQVSKLMEQLEEERQKHEEERKKHEGEKEQRKQMEEQQKEIISLLKKPNK